MKKHTVVRTGALLAASLLTLTACSGSAIGGGESSGNSGDSNSGSSVIKVGLTTALTGPYSEYGAPGAVGAQIAVDEFNELGLCEATVELITYDDQLDPESAQTNTRRLLDQDQVDFILGPAGTGPALATLPLVQAKDKVFINVIAQGADVVTPEGSDTPYADVFSFALGNIAEADFMQQFILDGGYVNVGIISESTPYGVGAAEILKAGLEDSGIGVASVERYDQGATDVNAQLARISSANADLIVFVGLGPDAATVRQAMARLDLLETPMLMSYAGGTLSFQERVEELVDGVHVVQFEAFDGSEPELAQAKHLAEAYHASEGNDVYYGNNEWPIPSFAVTAGPGYDSASVLLQAVAQADCTTDNAAVIEALDSGEAFSSSRGEYTFSPEDHVAVTSDVLTARTFQWNGGEISFTSAQ